MATLDWRANAAAAAGSLPESNFTVAPDASAVTAFKGDGGNQTCDCHAGSVLPGGSTCADPPPEIMPTFACEPMMAMEWIFVGSSGRRFCGIFQQDDAALFYVKRDFQISLGLDHAFVGRVIDDAGSKFRTQDAARVIIELRHGDGAGLHRLFHLGTVVGVERFLVIEPCCGGFDGAVRATPVREDESGELPFTFQHIGEKVFVLAGVIPVDGVVRAHDGARMADGNANLKRQQIAFLHGPLANDSVVLVAAALLIIHGVVLDIGNDVRGLLTLDAVADHGAGENGILTHVLKGATAAQFADQINAAAKSML